MQRLISPVLLLWLFLWSIDIMTHLLLDWSSPAKSIYWKNIFKCVAARIVYWLGLKRIRNETLNIMLRLKAVMSVTKRQHLVFSMACGCLTCSPRAGVGLWTQIKRNLRQALATHLQDSICRVFIYFSLEDNILNWLGPYIYHDLSINFHLCYQSLVTILKFNKK